MFARSHHRLSKKRRSVACRQYRRSLDGRVESEIYQDGMEFRAYICGNVIVKGDAADVYFTNSEKFDVWLKLRVLTADGILLGETGLIRPGEYVKSVSLTSEVEDGTAIKLKIMAYEPDTYYSAGSVTLNTILRKGGAE